MIILIKDIPQNTETSKLPYSIFEPSGVIFLFFSFFFNLMIFRFVRVFFFYIVAIIHVQMQFQNVSNYISTVTLYNVR